VFVVLLSVATSFACTKTAPSNPPSFADAIEAGRFVNVHPMITNANFPLVGPVAAVSDMLTVSPDGLTSTGNDVSLAEIESNIDRTGLHRATLADLLAYAKAKWNGRECVFALGSSWVDPRGHRNTPYLCDYGDGRELGLLQRGPEDRWDDYFSFLVVRK